MFDRFLSDPRHMGLSLADRGLPCPMCEQPTVAYIAAAPVCHRCGWHPQRKARAGFFARLFRRCRDGKRGAP